MELSYYKSMEPFWGVWRIRRLIGEGSFGKVFEIEREDFGRTYKAALKAITIPQSQSELKSVLADGMDLQSATNYYKSFVEEVVDEFALMAGLKGNSNIVSYEDHMVLEHKDGVGWDILIRMELLTPLLDYTTSEAPMGRNDVIRLGIDICRALEYCQKMNVIHRDIKPENIFISANGDYKLGDFGIARTVEKTTSGLSRKGTYVYMAPEVYKGEEYGASVDIYSLGIVLYRLLNRNRPPFFPDFPAPITHSDRESAIARRIGGQPIPMPCEARDALGEIIIKACAYAAKDRYHSPEEMRSALEQVLAASPDSSVHVTKEMLQALTDRRDADVSEEQTEVLIGDTENGQEETEKTESVYGAWDKTEEKTQEDVLTEEEAAEAQAGDEDGDLTISLVAEEPEMEAAEQETGREEQEERPSESVGKEQPPESGSEQKQQSEKEPKQEPSPERKPEQSRTVQRETPVSVSAAEKPKKKKVWLYVGIGLAVIAIIVYIIAWLTAGSDVASVYTDTDTPAPQSVFTESEESFSMGSSEMQREEAAGAGAEPEGVGADADNALLYGAYVYDGAVSWSEDPEENFELDMEYEDHPFGLGSALPVAVCFSPDGTMFEGPELYETGSDLEMSSEELFHEIAVYECGEEIAEETAAFYEEHIRGKMDVVQMSFVKKGGEVIECHGYYRLEGSVLEYGYLTKGILGSHLTMETKEYDVCFNGRNLELTRRGVARTLTPYGFDSMAASEPGISGYASSEADAYEGIAYIHVEDILSDNARAEIRFTDGSLAAAPSVRHTGDNTLTIQIEENGISKIVRYLSCGKIGFILQTDDGKNYLYQKSKADYYRENLREFAADLTDDDLNDLEDDLLTEMVRKKEEIASAIEEAREKSGYDGVFYTDCEVDPVNGTLMFSNDVLFDGDGTLTAEGKGILGNILPMYEQEVIGGYGEWIDTVYLETHSDSEGDYDYNMAASQLAAELMETWCEENCQEMWQYLEAEGYGSDFPVYDENGEEDGRRSRRTVLRITLDADAFASYMQDAVAEDEEAL